MNNAVTWSDELAGAVADERSSAVRRAIVLSCCILVATLGLSLAIYVAGKRMMEQRAVQVELRGGVGAAETNFDLLRHVDHIALSMTALAVVGGLGCLVPLFAAAMSWRRRVIVQMEEKAQQWQITAEGLQAQITEARRAKESVLLREARLEEQVSDLTAAKAQLQEDLAKRNRSERALTQRRQELESSKSVLEMHVQARTEQLEQLQRRYEMILNSAGEGICGLDLEGKATFVNPTVAKLTGWPLSDLLGKSEQEIFFHSCPPGSDSAPKANPDGEVFYRKDGTCFPVEVVRTPISENGQVEGSVLVFKDITQRKQAERALRESEERAVRVCRVARPAGAVAQNPGLRRPLESQVRRDALARSAGLPRADAECGGADEDFDQRPAGFLASDPQFRAVRAGGPWPNRQRSARGFGGAHRKNGGESRGRRVADD